MASSISPLRERVKIPLGRLGTGWEVAHGGLFLLSEESSNMTGQQLALDGGLTVWAASMSDGPRIPPIEPGAAPEDVAAILALEPEWMGVSLGENNIFATLAQHPDLFKAWLPYGFYLVQDGTLPVRDRELLILRTAVNCRSSYEWGQHVLIGARAGMERAEIDRVLEGPDAEGWSDHDAALLRAADELHADARISDATWPQLEQGYDRKQMIEATMLVGQYRMVANALNSFGVELDDWLEPLPAV